MGSVLFNFQRQGLVMVDASEGEDRVFEAAMDAGAADIQQALDEDGNLLSFKVGAQAGAQAGGRAGGQAGGRAGGQAGSRQAALLLLGMQWVAGAGRTGQQHVLPSALLLPALPPSHSSSKLRPTLPLTCPSRC